LSKNDGQYLVLGILTVCIVAQTLLLSYYVGFVTNHKPAVVLKLKPHEHRGQCPDKLTETGSEVES